MNLRSLFRLCIFILTALVIIPLLGVNILDPWLGLDVSGWVQAGIALVSFPIILAELDQIRQSVSRKPVLEVGLANIDDLPFSKIRQVPNMPDSVDVSTGYAHFYIILRNGGTAPARYVKVYVEHINRDQQVIPPPHIKVSEFSENKPSFVHEHNFDFVFRAGTEWIIIPNDIEPFGFHVTTSIMITEKSASGEPITYAQFPTPCVMLLDCTVWAEGLDKPIQKRLTVNVKANRERP